MNNFNEWYLKGIINTLYYEGKISKETQLEMLEGINLITSTQGVKNDNKTILDTDINMLNVNS